jgi:hypothetical protein
MIIGGSAGCAGMLDVDEGELACVAAKRVPENL